MAAATSSVTGGKVAKVWSRAASSSLRYLSNSTHVPGSTGIPCIMPDGKALAFRSIELAFHAHKFYCLCGGSRPDLAERLSLSGELGNLADGQQKGVGGKGAMKKLKVALDVARWNAQAVELMDRLVIARAEVDRTYAMHCKDLVSAGYTIVHYVARGGHDHLHLGPALQRLGQAMCQIAAA